MDKGAVMKQVYETLDGYYVGEGEAIYWIDAHSGKVNKSAFFVEYRYGELFEIQIGFESGGYTTRYSIDDLENMIYKNRPEV